MSNEIKIIMKKSELEYCFQAKNYAEFEKRFEKLKDLMYQRFINELTKENLKKSLINSIHGYIDTDIIQLKRGKKNEIYK